MRWCSSIIRHLPANRSRRSPSPAPSSSTSVKCGWSTVAATIPAGEPIVFAGAASIHRRAAFDAADYLMDRLKTEAVFWKREVGDGGSKWIEPTDADFADRDRWG